MAYRISCVRSASGELKVWRTILGVGSRWRARVIACWKPITRHYTILLYRVRTLTSHYTEESENSPESPHLGEIKRMRKQCVPGTSLFCARRDEARLGPVSVEFRGLTPQKIVQFVPLLCVRNLIAHPWMAGYGLHVVIICAAYS